VPPAGLTERIAVGFLCERLPELRARAEAGYWSDRLELNVDDVADGGSGLVACQDLGLLPDPHQGGTTRGAELPAVDGGRIDGLAPVTLAGRYGCPHGRCVRHADRDDRARVPECHLTGTPMVFQPET
jgi:hypothetical protein